MSERTPRGPRVHQVPEGDDRTRLVCPDCGYIRYDNPKMVVGAVATWGERLLLCRRAIPPREGLWTLPAGFLELGESPTEGAAREAWEEARAQLDIDALLAVYTLSHISQIQLIYRATLRDDQVAAGPESAEVGLFRWDELPWAELAFPSVHWALQHFDELRGQAGFAPRGNPEGATGKMGPG
jgi:ADP-ribose pyrophosphatase YjhB (NUDIX family)